MIFIRVFFASAAFLLIATYCNPLSASSVNPLDLPDLVRKADVIADATVSNLQSYTMWSPEGRTIHTRIALHELGHLLGLDHPDDAGQNVDAIMNSHVSNTDDLTADDIAGVRAIYGP